MGMTVLCDKNDIRLQQLNTWLQKTLNWKNYHIQIASADASFRRYFRLFDDQQQAYIIMDAPPEKEDTHPFIDITHRLLAANIHAPKIIAQSTELGFLILEDLGDSPYLNHLNLHSVDKLYQNAMQTLLQMQQVETQGLPNYDKNLLLTEMSLMPKWFLDVHLKITLTSTQNKTLQNIFQQLIQSALQQPQGFVHRDYHSRNLMITENDNPGIIDYQDAVYGAITYDLVSLLRDCYIHWSDEKVTQWVLDFKQLAFKKKLIPFCEDKVFLRWFDFMGLQRHIKVLGIFARLYHRDGKAGYLNDLPLTLYYVLNIANKYPETQPLVEIFDTLKIPEKISMKDLKL